jgi:GSH-dependent disulfide-bond oxidoreductase
MIDLYTWTTPNGRKVSVMLEECGLPYDVHPVDIGKDQQFRPEFVAICPNSKIPAIVDRDAGVSVFESGAILVHLAEKTGRLLPSTNPGRAKVLEWLMFQMANIGPMLGQANYFANTAAEKIPFAIDRYITESARLMKVMDDQLGRQDYLAGAYSIADIACYPWVDAGFPLLKTAKSTSSSSWRGERMGRAGHGRRRRSRRALARGRRGPAGSAAGDGRAEGLGAVTPCTMCCIGTALSRARTRASRSMP